MPIIRQDPPPKRRLRLVLGDWAQLTLLSQFSNHALRHRGRHWHKQHQNRLVRHGRQTSVKGHPCGMLRPAPTFLGWAGHYTQDHLVRAVMEGVLYNMANVFSTLESAGGRETA